MGLRRFCLKSALASTNMVCAAERQIELAHIFLRSDIHRFGLPPDIVICQA
jgi:hypothetical protein